MQKCFEKQVCCYRHLLLRNHYYSCEYNLKWFRYEKDSSTNFNLLKKIHPDIHFDNSDERKPFREEIIFLKGSKKIFLEGISTVKPEDIIKAHARVYIPQQLSWNHILLKEEKLHYRQIYLYVGVEIQRKKLCSVWLYNLQGLGLHLLPEDIFHKL